MMDRFPLCLEHMKDLHYFPLPDEHYIPHTKLGRSIEYLKDTPLMINEIYYLHNALLSKIEDIIQNIEAKYDQNDSG